jgi:hypothetical protein
MAHSKCSADKFVCHRWIDGGIVTFVDADAFGHETAEQFGQVFLECDVLQCAFHSVCFGSVPTHAPATWRRESFAFPETIDRHPSAR